MFSRGEHAPCRENLMTAMDQIQALLGDDPMSNISFP